MDDIFVIGGRDDNEDYFDSCLKFHTKSNELNEISKMNEERLHASCTVIEERVVVTGGYTFEAFLTTTVEAYEHLSDTWIPMPNMLEPKNPHSSVSVKNKLFVIGNLYGKPSCEVFDSSRKFVAL